MAYNSIDKMSKKNVNYWFADHASSHRNLFDNPFFTINSRGIDSTGVATLTGSTNVFCLDRWKFVRGTVKVTDGVVNYSTTVNEQFKRFCQGIQVKPNPGDELTVTFHGKINSISGSWYISTFGSSSGTNYQTSNIVELPDETGEFWIEKTFNVPSAYDDSVPFGVGIYSGDASSTIDIDIYSAKLERGNYSTLSMDYPPDYYTELIKCKTAAVESGDTEANKTIAFT